MLRKLFQFLSKEIFLIIRLLICVLITVILSDESEQDDKHPEKRRKAAFAEFSDLNLERLKTENPSLKLSQLKQILFKDWQKSPMNPMNK